MSQRKKALRYLKKGKSLTTRYNLPFVYHFWPCNQPEMEKTFIYDILGGVKLTRTKMNLKKLERELTTRSSSEKVLVKAARYVIICATQDGTLDYDEFNKLQSALEPYRGMYE